MFLDARTSSQTRDEGRLSLDADTMDAYRIVQYAAKEQAELRVRIKIPGSWKGFNNLSGLRLESRDPERD